MVRGMRKHAAPLLHHRQLPLDLLRNKAIVGIEKGDVLARCGLHAAVSGRPESTVWLANELGSRIGAAEFCDWFERFGRAVIDQNQLHPLMGLVQRAFCRPDHQVDLVEERQDHRNQRLGDRPARPLAGVGGRSLIRNSLQVIGHLIKK